MNSYLLAKNIDNGMKNVMKYHFCSLKKNRTGYQKIGPIIKKETGYKKIGPVIKKSDRLSKKSDRLSLITPYFLILPYFMLISGTKV